MSNKVLSISIAAYNVQQYLENTLNSILQCKRIDAVDVIIINDGSSDDTATIAHKFEEKVPHSIRVINKQNGGYGSTINTSIKVAQGKYYKLLDGDDWVDPQELDRLIYFLEKNNADLVVTKYCSIRNSEKKVHSLQWPYDGITRKIEDRLDYSYAMHMLTFKTETIRNWLISHPITEHANYTDVEYDLKTITIIHTVAFFDATVYQYRLGRKDQSVSLTSWFNHMDVACQVCINLARYYTNCVATSDLISDSVKKWALEQCSGSAAYKCQLFMMKGMGEESYNEIRKFLEQIKMINPDVYNDTLKRIPFIQKAMKNKVSFFFAAFPYRTKTILLQCLGR